MTNVFSKHSDQRTNALRTVVAGFCLIPLLIGCSASQESTASSSPSTQTTAASSSAPATTPAQTTVATGEPTPTASAITLPTVEDYCAGVCKEFSRTQAEHPQLGAVEVVTYGKPMHEGAVPATYEPSYAVYQKGNPVGIYTATGSEVVGFNPSALLGNLVWKTPTNVNVDKYGNLYYNTGTAIAVLTPTAEGYAQNGTLPAADKGEPKFEVKSEIDKSTNKPLTGLTIDGEGNARIVTEYKDGKPVSWEFNGTEFVQGSEPLA